MDRYLVVGRGLVGSMLSEDERFAAVSHRDWVEASEDGYAGIVCAAAMSTEAKCLKATMAEVIEANVYLPLRLLKLAKARNVPCVVFSTAGVYREAGVRKEEDDVSPHNRYAASKIMMEYALQNEAYQHLFIFRIPFVCLFNNHPSDLSGRVPNWDKCEDVSASVVYKAQLYQAVCKVMNSGGAKGGIFNIASGTIHFPTFLEDRFNWRGNVVPAHTLGKTPNSQLDTRKAEEAGLLPKQ